jgi:arsenate reductase-like glutaredoxin family protein
MNNKEFMEMREQFHDELTQLFNKKATEYDVAASRFEHFRRAAALKKCSTAQALMDMAIKHEVSIHDMVRQLTFDKHFDREAWFQKVGDLRNYCDLLWGVLTEEGEI